MIFIIPIILGTAALISGGMGVAVGADGVAKMKEAEKLGKDAQEPYQAQQKSVELTLQLTQR